MATVSDSYSETNKDTWQGVDGTTTTSLAQSFTSSFRGTLNNIQFYLATSGSPNANAVAKLYAHTGTYGTSSKPTGSAMATSDPFDASTLTASFQLIMFNFSGANQYLMDNGGLYEAAIEYVGGGGGIQCGIDLSSPSHGGNPATSLVPGPWSPDASYDACFYVYADLPVPTMGYIKQNKMRPHPFSPGLAR